MTGLEVTVNDRIMKLGTSVRVSHTPLGVSNSHLYLSNTCVRVSNTHLSVSNTLLNVSDAPLIVNNRIRKLGRRAMRRRARVWPGL